MLAGKRKTTSEMLEEIADLTANNKWHRKLVDYLASQLTEEQLAGLDETILLEISVTSRVFSLLHKQDFSN